MFYGKGTLMYMQPTIPTEKHAEIQNLFTSLGVTLELLYHPAPNDYSYAIVTFEFERQNVAFTSLQNLSNHFWRIVEMEVRIDKSFVLTDLEKARVLFYLPQHQQKLRQTFPTNSDFNLINYSDKPTILVYTQASSFQGLPARIYFDGREFPIKYISAT